MLSRRNNVTTKVCMMVSNDLSIDGRVQKEAAAVAEAGFEVIVVGIGTTVVKELKNKPYKLVLTTPQYKGKPLTPKLGREEVFYPLRVLVNLTVGRYRESRWKKTYMDSPYGVQVARPEMQSQIEALQPDIIHCHDLDTLWAGYCAAQKLGAKLVYDSHEIYLAMHFLSPMFKDQYAEIEAKVFPQIDGFVTVSPEVGEYLTTKYNSSITPVVTYNGGTHIVKEVQPIDGRVKLFFQGAFARDRNNTELVEAMAQLRDYATLTLQGWGQDKEEFERLIKEYHLEDTVFIIDPCGPLEVVDSASHYDVGVINSKCIDENFRHTLPNKLFDYMCAGLAIASTDLPPIKKIIDKAGCGITYEQKGVDHTAEVLKALVENPDEIMKMKEASLAAAPEYAWPAQAAKLKELYRSLDLEK